MPQNHSPLHLGFGHLEGPISMFYKSTDKQYCLFDE